MSERNLEFFKLANYIAGTALIILGFLGFVPAVSPDGMVFGIFMVDGFHNCVHVTVGFILLIAGIKPNKVMIVVTFLIGVIFFFLACFGFFAESAKAMFNIPDSLLHLAIAIFATFQGWVISKISE